MKDEDCQYIRQYFCYLIIIEPVILSYVLFLNVSLRVKMSKIHEKCSILRLYKQLLPPSSHAIWRSGIGAVRLFLVRDPEGLETRASENPSPKQVRTETK